MRPRDNQRSRLYSAQNMAGMEFRQTIPNDKLQAFVDSVLAHPQVKSRWRTKRTIAVKLGRGGGYADYYGSTITLGVACRTEWVILHEVAHCLTPANAAPHGPEFAGIFLFLTEVFVGKDAAARLREQYKIQRVRMTKSAVPAPLKREEQKLVEVRRAAKLAFEEADAALSAYRRANRERVSA